MHAVFSQEGGECGDQVSVVTVHPVREDRVVPNDAGEGPSGRGQLLGEPSPLLGFFVAIEMYPMGVLG